jgi:hypothetical protein
MFPWQTSEKVKVMARLRVLSRDKWGGRRNLDMMVRSQPGQFDYKYIVTSGSTAHTAFRTKRGYKRVAGRYNATSRARKASYPLHKMWGSLVPS